MYIIVHHEVNLHGSVFRGKTLIFKHYLVIIVDVGWIRSMNRAVSILGQGAGVQHYKPTIYALKTLIYRSTISPKPHRAIFMPPIYTNITYFNRTWQAKSAATATMTKKPAHTLRSNTTETQNIQYLRHICIEMLYGQN